MKTVRALLLVAGCVAAAFFVVCGMAMAAWVLGYQIGAEPNVLCGLMFFSFFAAIVSFLSYESCP